MPSPSGGVEKALCAPEMRSASPGSRSTNFAVQLLASSLGGPSSGT